MGVSSTSNRVKPYGAAGGEAGEDTCGVVLIRVLARQSSNVAAPGAAATRCSTGRWMGAGKRAALAPPSSQSPRTGRKFPEHWNPKIRHSHQRRGPHRAAPNGPCVAQPPGRRQRPLGADQRGGGGQGSIRTPIRAQTSNSTGARICAQDGRR